MKLATYETALGEQRVAAIDTAAQRALDLAEAAQCLGIGEVASFNTMLALIEAGADGLARARELEARWPEGATKPLAEIRLLSPLPQPRSIRDCLVFEEHLINAMRALAEISGTEPAPPSSVWYERPAYYKANALNVIGTDADIVWPFYAEKMDYELELACVIGRKGKDISKAQAMDHIFGFTIYNDISARDAQAYERRLGMGPTKGKDFDTGNILGPWITTLDEIGDPHHLDMKAWVNGERQGGGNSSSMHHRFEDIIAFISRAETIHPGEVIATGTVGTGCGLELGRFLEPDDVVELEIERIGVLRNRIVRSS